MNTRADTPPPLLALPKVAPLLWAPNMPPELPPNVCTVNLQESFFHKKNGETFESTATPAPKLELEAPPGGNTSAKSTETGEPNGKLLLSGINSTQSACSKQAGTSRCTCSTSWRKEAQLLQQSLWGGGVSEEHLKAVFLRKCLGFPHEVSRVYSVFAGT